MPEVFTIGHSNVETPRFLELLQQHRIEVLADVRSSPYSAWLPHFNREPLEKALKSAGLKYVFLGDELGARRSERDCYVDGRADYNAVATLPKFRKGLDRVRAGAAQYRVALMCAEKDPLECHRTVLVARRLFEAGLPVNHILADGAIETHPQAEARLLAEEKVPSDDLFLSREDLLAQAYERRGRKIAWQEAAEKADERA